MTRRRWIGLVTVALFGVQAPLCAVACVQAIAAQELAAAEGEHDAHPSCHGDGPGASDAPPPPDHDCECDRLEVVAASAKGAHAPGTADAARLVAAPLARAALVAVAPAHGWTRLRARQSRLPPPDLLLLNVVLLL